MRMGGLLLLFGLVWAGMAQAEDKVFLKNGSVLIGTLQTMDENTVVIKIQNQDLTFLRSEIKKIKNIRVEEEDTQPKRTYQDLFWGLGLAAGTSTGIGVQNALRAGRFQWNVILWPPVYESKYFAGTELQFDVIQSKRFRFLTYAGYSTSNATGKNPRLGVGLGVGFLLRYVEITGGFGLQLGYPRGLAERKSYTQSEFGDWDYNDIRVSATYFF